MKNPAFLARAAVIAALYAVLTLAIAPLSYGVMQLRVSEALMFLPAVSGAAVPGLFVGCVVANAIGAAMGMVNALDILIGSTATLVAVLLTRALRNRPFWVYMAPPVLANAVIVGAELNLLIADLNMPMYLTMLYVGLGELISCYGVGWPLSKAVKKLEKYWN